MKQTTQPFRLTLFSPARNYLTRVRTSEMKKKTRKKKKKLRQKFPAIFCEPDQKIPVSDVKIIHQFCNLIPLGRSTFSLCSISGRRFHLGKISLCRNWRRHGDRPSHFMLVQCYVCYEQAKGTRGGLVADA